MGQAIPAFATLDGGLQGYIFKTASKNLWRVASFMDLDDLIQEGYLAYAICVKRYAYGERIRGVKNTSEKDCRRRFMKLFKVIYANRITNLANAKRKSVPQSLFTDLGTAEHEFSLERLSNILGTDQGIAYINALIAQAPEEVKKLLRLFCSEDGLKQLQNVPARDLTTLEHRESPNQFFCRLVGLDPKQVNLVKLTRDLLTA